MKGYLVLLALCGVAAGAPQNWPYRDSLMPYRYGYPNQQAQYKYLPQIEDDEEVGPYYQMGRQEFVVGSDGQSSPVIYHPPEFSNKAWFAKWKMGDRVIPTLPPPSVVETGSVAPVIEQSKIPTTAVPPPTPKAPLPPPPKPHGAQPPKPVQPPAFPPARPPPPPKREKEEEDEDEDDDESDEENDDDDDQAEDGDEDDDHDDDEDDRRRQEPLFKDEPEKKEEKKEKAPVVKSVVKTVVKSDKPKPAVVEPPAPVVVPKPIETKTVVKSASSTKVPTTSVDENEDKPVVDSNEVVRPNEADDESSEEQGLGDGVEALVPGYVTEQGEILVPVDTVTGDQPISIVPDPYTPPTRGVPLRNTPTYRNRAPYDDMSFNNHYYYPNMYPVARQEESEEVEQTQQDDTQQDDDKSSGQDSESVESDDETSKQPARNEFLTDFPPSRSPEFYAVIKSKIPATSSEEEFDYEPQSVQGYQGYPPHQGYQAYQPQQRYQGYPPHQRYQGYPPHQGYQGFHGASPYAPVYVRRRPQPQQQEVSLAVSLSNSNQAQSQYGNRAPAYQPHPVANRYPGPYSNPYLRNPYGYYKVPVYRPQHGSSPYLRRPVNPFYSAYQPRPVFKRPVYNPYTFGGSGASSGQFTPVFIKRNPYTGVGPVKKPVTFTKRPAADGTTKQQQVKTSPVTIRRPTPVTYQDDEPYPYQQPMTYHIVQDTSSASDESSNSQQVPVEMDSSSVETPKIVTTGTTRSKSRRAAKMTKKFEKKSSMKQKKVTDPDPLNILKKISTKRS